MLNGYSECKGVSVLHETRKQIIINEIVYWKQNHLLPEHYCDFLLALYTQGNGIQAKSTKKSFKKGLYFLLLIPVFIFLFYFTELSLILQIVFGVILFAGGIYLSYFLVKRGSLYQVPLIISAFILLFTSVELTLNIFSNTLIPLYTILSINCIIWLLTGWRFKQLYFMISGIIGLILIISSLFMPFSFLGV